jgi:hypothetical protein
MCQFGIWRPVAYDANIRFHYRISLVLRLINLLPLLIIAGVADASTPAPRSTGKFDVSVASLQSRSRQAWNQMQEEAYGTRRCEMSASWDWLAHGCERKTLERFCRETITTDSGSPFPMACGFAAFASRRKSLHPQNRTPRCDARCLCSLARASLEMIMHYHAVMHMNRCNGPALLIVAVSAGHRSRLSSPLSSPISLQSNNRIASHGFSCLGASRSPYI